MNGVISKETKKSGAKTIVCYELKVNRNELLEVIRDIEKSYKGKRIELQVS
jgi:hypothetical protein